MKCAFEMKHLVSACLAAAAVVAANPASAGAYSFEFLASDGSYQAAGVLNTADTANSVSGYDILGISGYVSGAAGGGISALVTNPNQPFLTTDYSIGFIYDNVVYPGGTQKLDIGGVLFKTGDTVWNLWGNSARDYELYSWDFSNGLGYSVDKHGSFTLSPVPEPETYAMLFAGLSLMGFIARTRKHKAAL